MSGSGTQPRLKRQIASTTAVLLVFQTTIVVGTWYRFDLSPALTLRYVASLVALHLIIYAFLRWRRMDFVTESDHRLLNHLNFANRLTIFRLSSMPTLLFLLSLAEHRPVMVELVVLTAAVFLSDLIDGKVSRRSGEVTKVGQYLDSSSDYAVLFAVSILLFRYALIEVWFFVLMMVRLVSQTLSILGIFLFRRSIRIGATKWGKVSVFSVMTLYAVVLLRLVPALRDPLEYPGLALQIVVGVLIVVSVVEKVALLTFDLRGTTREQT